MDKKDWKNFMWGALFGIFASLIGIFIGLQVSSSLGTILLSPAILISKVINQPFRNFSAGLVIFTLVFTLAVWGGVFVLLGRLRRALR